MPFIFKNIIIINFIIIIVIIYNYYCIINIISSTIVYLTRMKSISPPGLIYINDSSGIICFSFCNAIRHTKEKKINYYEPMSTWLIVFNLVSGLLDFATPTLPITSHLKTKTKTYLCYLLLCAMFLCFPLQCSNVLPGSLKLFK